MAELAELEAPATIQASVNYMVEDGQKLFTYTGGPGSTDIRSDGSVVRQGASREPVWGRSSAHPTACEFTTA